MVFGMAVELGAIRSVVDHLDGRDLEALDAAGRRRVMERLRSARQQIDGLSSMVLRLERADLAGRPSGDDLALGLGGVSGREARKAHARSEVADVLPEVGSRFEAGRAAPEKVDALARAVARLGDDASKLAEHDAWLASHLAERTVDQFATDVRALVSALQDDGGDAELERQVAASSLRQWVGDDGMGHTHLTLDPVRHAELETQVQAALSRLCAEPGRSRSNESAAAALLSLVADGVNQPGRAPRAQVTVLVDAETVERGHHAESVCETENGTPVPPRALDRFLCDADVHLALTGPDGRVDRVAAAKRTATAAQRRMLRAMYPTCAHPGCDATFDRCQIHHLDHWADGGPTVLANLLPLCSTHHHLEHDGGWSYRLGPDRTLVVLRPDGSEHTRCPLPEPPRLPPELSSTGRRRRRSAASRSRPVDTAGGGGPGSPATSGLRSRRGSRTNA